VFPTLSGKAQFLAREHIELEDRPSRAYPLILTTGRLPNQWHTRTKTGRVPVLNKLDPAPYLQMHPEDAAGLGLHDRQQVNGVSRFGTADTFLKLDEGISPGVVFMPIHWNELWGHRSSPNEATSNLRDPLSKQPALKAVAVNVTPAGEDQRRSSETPESEPISAMLARPRNSPLSTTPARRLSADSRSAGPAMPLSK